MTLLTTNVDGLRRIHRGKVRETYDMELDAKYAAARGFVDAIIRPHETREAESDVPEARPR